MGWTIRRQGHDLEVATGGQRESRLIVDGTEVDAQTAGYWESSTLTHDDLEVEVRWGPRNTIAACHVIERDAERDGQTKVPLIPPPGSKAAKREEFARDHPTLFVLRRVGVAGAEILIGVLGVSALLAAFFGSLLPRIDLSWLPLPSLPDVDAPDWLRYLDPLHWLGKLGLSWPDIGIPGWIEAAFEQKKYWLPIVIALFVALGELERRKKRDAERAASENDDK